MKDYALFRPIMRQTLVADCVSFIDPRKQTEKFSDAVYVGYDTLFSYVLMLCEAIPDEAAIKHFESQLAHDPDRLKPLIHYLDEVYGGDLGQGIDEVEWHLFDDVHSWLVHVFDTLHDDRESSGVLQCLWLVSKRIYNASV